MFSQVSNSLLRRCNGVAISKIITPAQPASLQQLARFGTTDESGTILKAWENSCYNKMEFAIKEDATVFEAVQQFSAYRVGALVVINSAGDLSGLISERDYVKKIALLGRTSKDTLVKDVFTTKANLVTASTDDSVDSCMSMMMTKGVRHLPILDGNKVVGIVSIKDLVKTVFQDKEDTIKALSDFALGKKAKDEVI